MGFADPAQGVDPWALDEQAATPTLLENCRTYAGGRVRSWVGLEHLFYCSAEDFKAAAALAEEFDTGLHTHSSETIWEVEESLRQFGRRPIEVYNRSILGPRTVVAHCVWLDDRKIELLARSGTSVAHCPCSNAGPGRQACLLLLRAALGHEGRQSARKAHSCAQRTASTFGG
jgi:cytosine/adenosine deaminase-related metal-dependent hydrolase